MRILVTGHKGYIGTVMVPMLQAEGYEVVGLDNDLFEECTFGNPPLEIPYIKKDIRDVKDHDLHGFDIIVHLAALSNDPLGNFRPKITYSINHQASVRLAELAKRAGARRYLFSSSCSVYGASGGSMLNEQSKTRPITPYGVSKIRAEKDIAELADPDFSPIFLRSATAYGVSSRLRFDLVLNNLVAWAYTTGLVWLKSDGTAWRPVVHIEDISRAFIAALKAPCDLIHNQTFNVGITKENYQICELADIVKETVPGSHVEYSKDAGIDKRSYRVDCSKIHQTFPEFKPLWDVRKGAKQLYDAYSKVGIACEDFEGSRYKRLEHLKKILDSGYLDSTLRPIENPVLSVFARHAI